MKSNGQHEQPAPVRQVQTLLSNACGRSIGENAPKWSQTRLDSRRRIDTEPAAFEAELRPVRTEALISPHKNVTTNFGFG